MAIEELKINYKV